ncbi:MAG: D-alanyl-D-alanine carboxypeptidase family protein [Clostridia bacterium]|nr:D-alanyl-D-alanine carboxypeptidase family protein [Clostridia bacterium]
MSEQRQNAGRGSAPANGRGAIPPYTRSRYPEGYGRNRANGPAAGAARTRSGNAAGTPGSRDRARVGGPARQDRNVPQRPVRQDRSAARMPVRQQGRNGNAERVPTPSRPRQEDRRTPVRPDPRGYSLAAAKRDAREAARREAESRARLEALRSERRRAELERRRREEAIRAERIKRQKREIREKMRVVRKKQRKEKRKTFFARFLIGAVIFVLLGAISAGIFAYSFFRSPDAPKSSGISYVFGGTTVRTADRSTAYRDGVLYICFNDLADYLSMATTGSAGEMTFVFPKWDEKNDSSGTGDEMSVTFTDKGRTVSVGSRRITVEAECATVGENMWVPLSFAEEYVEGIKVVFNKKKNTVSVSRLEDEELSVKGKPVYLPVSLKLKDQFPAEGYVPGNAIKVPDVTFITDLSSYETYMNPPDASEYLVLVNADHPLSAASVPEDLTDLPMTRQDGRATAKARLYAANALEALFAEMAAMGFDDVSVTSGYRSYADQTALFENYVAGELEADPSLSREAAEEIVTTYSSRPGTSEHQTGLSVDMHNMEYANAEFANTEVYRWLEENAWKFGFILRFPEGKTDLTGVKFEPWHWRYVGRAAAYAIKEQKLCLEEYAAK